MMRRQKTCSSIIAKSAKTRAPFGALGKPDLTSFTCVDASNGSNEKYDRTPHICHREPIQNFICYLGFVLFVLFCTLGLGNHWGVNFLIFNVVTDCPTRATIYCSSTRNETGSLFLAILLGNLVSIGDWQLMNTKQVVRISRWWVQQRFPWSGHDMRGLAQYLSNMSVQDGIAGFIHDHRHQ